MAAWWNVAALSLSLLNLFKGNFLPEEGHSLRPKAMRHEFFVMIGKFVRHARRLVLKVHVFEILHRRGYEHEVFEGGFWLNLTMSSWG